MTSSRFIHRFTVLALASGMALGAGSFIYAQTAGQEIHKAGSNTEKAAKETGSATKKTTAKAYHKTKQGAATAAHKTKKASAKAYKKTTEGAQHVVNPK